MEWGGDGVVLGGVERGVVGWDGGWVVWGGVGWGGVGGNEVVWSWVGWDGWRGVGGMARDGAGWCLFVWTRFAQCQRNHHRSAAIEVHIFAQLQRE